ncbi:hypothetical protein IAS59_004979 [Cryptococcus gattii]
MDYDSCTRFCDSLGYAYAGNSINSGASLQPYNKCGNLCLGNWWQDCGGSNYINVFHKTSSSGKKVSSTVTAQAIPSATGMNTRTTSSSSVSSAAKSSTSSFASSTSAAFSTGSATVTSSVSGFEITSSTSATTMAEVIFSSSTSAGNVSSTSSSDSEAAFITDSSPNPMSILRSLLHSPKAPRASESASSIVSPIASETEAETEATSITSSAADIATSISISISSTEESTTSSTAVSTSTAMSMPSGWSVSTCIGEGSAGRALTGTSTSSSDMTEAKCAAFCAASGYTLAGIEYSSECYCGSILSNGASLTQTSSACTMPCSGDSSSICGGPSALTLVVSDTAASTLNSYLTSKPVSLPSG